MEIYKDDNERVVEIWLRREEADDQVLRELLKPKIAAYKRQKYLVAIYESGTGDLKEGIKALLQHNLHVMVEKERLADVS
ncbi:hypothetical protein V6615_08575 [Oscillospiraceae bacterium PP1C4]